MTRNIFLKALASALVLSICHVARARIPAAEQLLPPDTLVVLTVPDWEQAVKKSELSPVVQWWRDPAMKPFADRLEQKISESFQIKMESGRKVNLPGLMENLKGQLTVAVTQGGLKTGGEPGVVFLLDARDRKAEIKKEVNRFLDALRDSGEKVETETVGEIEFRALKIDSSEKRPGKQGSGRILVGLVDSLLVVGNGPDVIESVVSRAKGNSKPSLAGHALFQQDHKRMFEKSMFFGWINMTGFMDLVLAQMNDRQNEQQNLFAISPDRILDAIGLKSLKTIAFAGDSLKEGALMEFFIGAPFESRKGLFKLLAPLAKPSGPLPFVAAESTKYSRWRRSGAEILNSIERMVSDAVPPIGGIISMMIDNAGKAQNSAFDIRRQLIDNIGDDIITVEKAPRGESIEDFQKAPALYLLSSPNPDALLDAIRTGLGGMGGSHGREEKINGQLVVSLPVMPMTLTPVPGQMVRPDVVYLTSARGYVGFSSDRAMIEEYLRGGPGKDKALPGVNGLADATAKIGGFETGWFGYENPRELVRVFLSAIRKNPELWKALLADAGVKEDGKPNQGLDFMKEISEFIKLLPPFERIEKYLHYSVYAADSTDEGITFKSYSPTPPALLK